MNDLIDTILEITGQTEIDNLIYRNRIIKSGIISVATIFVFVALGISLFSVFFEKGFTGLEAVGLIIMELVPMVIASVVWIFSIMEVFDNKDKGKLMKIAKGDLK